MPLRAVKIPLDWRVRFVLLCTAMALAVVLPIVAAIPVVPVLVLGRKW